MIVDAFTETLEIGLESPGQVVVSANRLISSRLVFFGSNCSPLRVSFNVAYDTHFRVRVAIWARDWGISGTRPWCARPTSTSQVGNLTNAQVERTFVYVS